MNYFSHIRRFIMLQMHPVLDNERRDATVTRKRRKGARLRATDYENAGGGSVGLY